jgi:hypothetical protein
MTRSIPRGREVVQARWERSAAADGVTRSTSWLGSDGHRYERDQVPIILEARSWTCPLQISTIKP